VLLALTVIIMGMMRVTTAWVEVLQRVEKNVGEFHNAWRVVGVITDC